jgi:AcrR family transcriptional regulator
VKGVAATRAAAPPDLDRLSPEAERWVSRPRQSRSQQTLTRLVHAGARLLQERPFAAITVADLVAEARSSVGSFYARFDDKDAFLGLLHEYYQQQVMQGVDALLDPQRVSGLGIEATLRQVVPVFVATHRDVGGMMRALHAQAAVDDAFRVREEQMNRHIARRFSQALLQWRDDIGHPDPERAIDFAVVSLLGALIQRVFFRGPGALAFDDAQFSEHLIDAFLAHLRVRRRAK